MYLVKWPTKTHSGARVMHHLSIRTNCVIMFCHFEQMLENFMILTYVSQDQCNFFLLQVVWNRLKLISGVNYKWSIQSFYEICEFSKIKTPSKSSISPERFELALTLSKKHMVHLISEFITSVLVISCMNVKFIRIEINFFIFLK